MVSGEVAAAAYNSGKAALFAAVKWPAIPPYSCGHVHGHVSLISDLVVGMLGRGQAPGERRAAGAEERHRSVLPCATRDAPKFCAAANQLPDFEPVGLLPESKAVYKKLVRPTKQTIEEFMELEGSEFPVS